ncbi:hypothetical protein ACN28I_04920 [Archangium gephyra]|uniref:hypothetical protein n=1 Tax=Archangium gephyra TaxID=48 RepID=UPI003B773A51
MPINTGLAVEAVRLHPQHAVSMAFLLAGATVRGHRAARQSVVITEQASRLNR